MARTERGLQAAEHGVHVDRTIGRHGDRSSDDRFVHVAGPDRVACGRDRGEVVVDLDAGGDRVLGSGWCGIGRAEQVDVGVVDRGDPASPVGALADRHLRDDEFGLGTRQERYGAHGDRPVCAADPVVVLDRGQERHGLVDRHPRRHSSAGEADAVADEEVAVTAGDVVQVEIGVERNGDGAHQSRVPSSCCVSPPDSRWCDASQKPAVRSMDTISSGSGR